MGHAEMYTSISAIDSNTFQSRSNQTLKQQSFCQVLRKYFDFHHPFFHKEKLLFGFLTTKTDPKWKEYPAMRSKTMPPMPIRLSAKSQVSSGS